MSIMRPCSTRTRQLSSTSTDDKGNGWHSGISSAVRLAAMMPASWATLSTSPFPTSLRSISANVSGRISTRPEAVAIRSVTALPVTSTMTALPVSSKWVKALMPAA